MYTYDPTQGDMFVRVAREINNEEKVGQFLLSFVSLCHEKGIDAETALRKAITNYRKEHTLDA